MKNIKIELNPKTLEITQHIFESRIDNSLSPLEHSIWSTAKAIFDYALCNNLEALRNYDYLETAEEKEEVEDSNACMRESLGNGWW